MGPAAEVAVDPAATAAAHAARQAAEQLARSRAVAAAALAERRAKRAVLARRLAAGGNCFEHTGAYANDMAFHETNDLMYWEVSKDRNNAIPIPILGVDPNSRGSPLSRFYFIRVALSLLVFQTKIRPGRRKNNIKSTEKWRSTFNSMV